MKETELFNPIKDWLKAQSYKVYAEVSNPVAGTCLIDVVGVKDRLTIAIEMKLSLSKTVITQAYRARMVANKVYCAVPCDPKQKGIEECKKYGVGILKISDKVEILLECPEENNHFFEQYSLIKNRNFDTMEEGVEAGMPCEKGVGMTYDLCNAIREYQKTNPNATWKEIYKNIDNHYSSPNSMASSLRHWRGFSLK